MKQKIIKQTNKHSNIFHHYKITYETRKIEVNIINKHTDDVYDIVYVHEHCERQ